LVGSSSRLLRKELQGRRELLHGRCAEFEQRYSPKTAAVLTAFWTHLSSGAVRDRVARSSRSLVHPCAGQHSFHGGKLCMRRTSAQVNLDHRMSPGCSMQRSWPKLRPPHLVRCFLSRDTRCTFHVSLTRRHVCYYAPVCEFPGGKSYVLATSNTEVCRTTRPGYDLSSFAYLFSNAICAREPQSPDFPVDLKPASLR